MVLLTQPVANDSAPRSGAGRESEPASRSPVAENPMARLNDRAIAALVDLVVIAAAYAVVGNWAAMRWGGVRPNGFELTGMTAAVAIALTALVAFVYYWVLEGTIGATVGKALVGIRVRDVSGRAAGLGASLTRNLCRLIDGLGVYLVGWIIALSSKRRQRLGDYLAHTVVVTAPGRSRRILGAVGLAAWLVVAAIGALAVRRGGAKLTPGSSAPARVSGGPSGVQRNASSQPAVPAALASDAASSAGSSLTLSNVVWSDAADGPPRSADPYARGSTAFGTYELDGFARASDGHVDVAIRVTPTDPNGLALMAPLPSDVKTTGAAAGSIHGRFEVHLPPYAPAGMYTMRMLVHDAIGGGDAQFAPAFAVSGPSLVPAGALEVRDFAFANPDGSDAGAHPQYHAGQTVSFAAKFSGLAFRHDSVDLSIGLALVGPSGTPMMQKDDWAAFADGPIYHPNTFFVPVGSNVTLPSPLPAGTYALRFTVSDKVAAATMTYNAHFDVR
jgi:uncharacterized RDD family membrane protein YckC